MGRDAVWFGRQVLRFR